MHDFIQYLFHLLGRGLMLVIPITLVVVIALFILWRSFRKRGRKFPWKAVIVGLLLAGWAMLTLFVTLMRGEGGMFSVWNLHLFYAWREAWNQFTLQFWLNILLSIALFVSLGILLPLLCRLSSVSGDTQLAVVANSLVTLKAYQNEEIIPPAAAVEALKSERSAMSGMLHYIKPTEVEIRSCTLDWTADTKGFYQPVYRLELVLPGEEHCTDWVPALK